MGQWLRVEACDREIRVRFDCGVPLILASSLRIETKNTGGPLCVCTSHMQFKDPPLPLRKE